ncbi:MAG: AbrB/MazE/SpoVT family DNA-binding domain-containing protein [Chloroflexi bacterium]|nr:AbrB/MazE/SpoVT family DNA-binding domain-containing protein [Chloroflexota bacterium]
MAVTRIGPKHQITIPQDVFQKLGLEVGDFLEVRLRGDALYLVPQKLVPRDQAWFWTKEWQEREREADEAIARSELSGPFESADDLIRHLRSK